MNIKRVAEADFRRADLGIWTLFCSESSGRKLVNRVLVESLTKDDVVAFVSKRGNQLLFIHGFEQLKTICGDARTMLPSVRYRIVNGTWSPYMLANYALNAGIKVEGIKSFEEHFGYLIDGTRTAR